LAVVVIISCAHSAARVAMNRAVEFVLIAILAIVHIERDLKYIDAAFEKMKSDITNNISDIDKQKRKCLSDISDMGKSLNDHIKCPFLFLNFSIHNTRHFVYCYERLEICSIFLYFIHILPNIIKVSPFGFKHIFQRKASRVLHPNSQKR
jgi:hypothetical protein